MSFIASPQHDDLAVESWLPGETLFSLASRHHIVSCNWSPSDTCRQLFGSYVRRANHDFPSHIDFFVDSTHLRLGTAEEVIINRTLLPFYLPLNNKAHAEDAICSLRGDRIGSLRYKLGMLLDRFRGRHPLRACKLCMQDDFWRFGVAYWHHAHQIPGVWRCPHHHSPLWVSSDTGTFSGHYDWCLPRNEGLTSSESPDASIDDLTQADSLERFASAALSLTSLAPTVYLDGQLLGRIYSDRLVSVGLRETGGSLCLADCIALILRNSAPLRAIAELSPLPGTADGARAYVSRLCWEPAVRMHPLLHLFTIVWLFGNWDAFWQIIEPDLKDRPRKADADLAIPCSSERNASYRKVLADVMAEESRR
jgi:hypothetical protein